MGRTPLERAIPERISKDIETFGIIKVLREGIKVENIALKLWYPKPSPADAQENMLLFQQNQFSVTRQQTYSHLKPGDEIDMVLYVNGLPILPLSGRTPGLTRLHATMGRSNTRKTATRKTSS